MSLSTEISQLLEAVNRLTEEVSQRQAVIENTVNNKIAELEQWKNNVQAAQLQGESRYESIIDLTGLSTERYYPVWWQFPDNRAGESKITLSRAFSENKEDYPFGSGVTHLAGLLLQMEGNNCAWGGDAYHMSIIRLSQTYRKTVREIQGTMKCIARAVNHQYPIYGGLNDGDTSYCLVYGGVYLRGGLTYHSIRNFNAPIQYSRQDEEVELYSTIDHQLKMEIKWMVKSYAIDDPFLGPDYEEYREAYTRYNDSRYVIKK